MRAEIQEFPAKRFSKGVCKKVKLAIVLCAGEPEARSNCSVKG